MPFRGYRIRGLALLLFCAVLFAQLVAYAPGHSDNHADHCCGVCHASHVSLLTAAAVVQFAPPSVRAFWRLRSDELPSIGERSASSLKTRGPPSSFFLAA